MSVHISPALDRASHATPSIATAGSTIHIGVAAVTVHGSQAARIYLVHTRATSYPQYRNFGLQQVSCDSHGHEAHSRVQSSTRHT